MNFEQAVKRTTFAYDIHINTMLAQYSQVLSNKRVLVLGGSSGIGFGVAEHALVQGAVVSIASSRQANVDDAIARLQKSVPDAKDRITGLICDLSDASSLKNNLEALLKSATFNGLLDHIVYTSGDAFQLGPLADLEVADLHKLGTVRFFGPMVLVGLAPKYMNASKASSITLTSGVKSKKPSKGWTQVASYGGGLHSMARSAAVELAPIRVNTVSPGFVVTAHTGRFEAERPAFEESYRQKSLTQSVGTPEELSEAYIYLMRCSFATGTLVEADGGYLLVP